VLYKRIASADDAEELRDLQVEMIDRFGLLPDSTKCLFGISEIKQQAKRIGIDKIDFAKSNGRLIFSNAPSIDPAKIIELIQTQPQIFKLDGPQKLRFSKKLNTTEEKVEFILDLINSIALSK
jgi:transcription-repair coupling factor (superfamily II helicase)